LKDKLKYLGNACFHLIDTNQSEGSDAVCLPLRVR